MTTYRVGHTTDLLGGRCMGGRWEPLDERGLTLANALCIADAYTLRGQYGMVIRETDDAVWESDDGCWLPPVA